ncbi:proline-rich protein 2-like [Moschus berezovskii]|uniref:proline-rich protein 2-like n=1 Tax=Moschus berezovskii TaxID=68408 RepID=UPI002443E596|nr:proline-rich protein 2-like [Moschus berezovskii]
MPAPKHSLEAGASGQPSLSEPALRSTGMRVDPGRDGVLAPAPRCPARFCRPGLPCPQPGTPAPPAAPPPQWTEAPRLLLRHKGSPSGRGLAAGAPSRKDQSGGRPRRQGQGPTPGRPRRTSGMPDPGADEQAGLARAAGAGGWWQAPTCPSAAAGSGWPPVGHVDAPLSPTPPRSRARAAAAHTLGPARGRRGLLNPDRTTAPGRGAQGGPSSRALDRGGGRLSPSHGRGPVAELRPGERRSSPLPPAARRPSPPPRAMAASGARAPQPAASRHPGTRALPRHTPFGPGERVGLEVALGGAPKATCRRFSAPTPPHPGHDPTGTHQLGTRGPDPGHSRRRSTNLEGLSLITSTRTEAVGL